VSELCASKVKFLNSNSFNWFSEGWGLFYCQLKIQIQYDELNDASMFENIDTVWQGYIN